MALPFSMTSAPDGMIEESVGALEHRIVLAELERDALQLAGQEENYLRACSMVEALELQLEERLVRAGGEGTAG